MHHWFNSLYCVLTLWTKSSESEFMLYFYSPVLCNATAFQCSPVQCVPKTAICNGIQDCDNGRDEYCGKLTLIIDFIHISLICLIIF